MGGNAQHKGDGRARELASPRRPGRRPRETSKGLAVIFRPTVRHRDRGKLCATRPATAFGMADPEQRCCYLTSFSSAGLRWPCAEFGSCDASIAATAGNIASHNAFSSEFGYPIELHSQLEHSHRHQLGGIPVAIVDQDRPALLQRLKHALQPFVRISHQRFFRCRACEVKSVRSRRPFHKLLPGFPLFPNPAKRSLNSQLP